MKFRLNEGLENIIYKPVEDTDKFKQYAAEILGGDGNMSASDIKASIKEIYIDEKLIGYIGFSEYEEDDVKMLGIGNFMVIERGQGYGTKIINDVVETNKDKYDLIYCFVDADNAGAIKLYKKLGSVYDEDGPNDNGQYYVTFYDNGRFDLDESLTEGLNKSEVKSAMQAIYDEYEKYNIDDGNQNCMLCAWALEMQLRGNKDFLPRPVYSPRDIIFQDINGYDIVVGAEKLSLENKDSVSSIARDAGADARFYCHVNWAGLQSGHEFLILNIQDTIYIADAQANALVDIEEDDEYFRDINFKNSFLVRLDNKAINDNTLKYNDDEYIIEWDDELDPAFLKGEVTEEFDPPYNEEQIKANYGDETYQRLIDDPAHAWRMKTGIELIHKEPSKKELERIWANWQEMTDEQKAESDKKSIELFGKTNEENYNELINLYESAKNESELYCISQEDLDGQTLEPRVPNNFFTKNGYEDGETPRVCFTPSVDQCLMAISQKCEGIEFYVFKPEEVPEENIYKPTVEEVPDSEITDETWITCPVKLKKVGKIKVLGDSGLDGHPFNYGDKTAELYDWDWEWLD
jgi:RimJ/RimL family protein N-acetyltransferase